MNKITLGLKRFIIRKTMTDGLKKYNRPIPSKQELNQHVDELIYKINGDSVIGDKKPTDEPKFEVLVAGLPMTGFQVIATCETCDDTSLLGEVEVPTQDDIPEVVRKRLEEEGIETPDNLNEQLEQMAFATAMAKAMEASHTDFDDNDVLHVHRAAVVKITRSLAASPQKINETMVDFKKWADDNDIDVMRGDDD